jgi:anhydro-N-acetylmuramic acid kinase
MTDLALGIMSGTSLDGVDVALVEVADERSVSFRHFLSRPYAAADREAIRRAIEGPDVATVAQLDEMLAERFATAAAELLDEAGIASGDLAVVGSHGQTISHVPGKASVQVGNGTLLSERLGVPVVNDFRSADIAAGGQGAPLVPIADAMLFAGSDPRVLLNVGGMSNVTWVRMTGALDDLVAFDTGPGVAIIDGVTRLVDPSVEFDRDGERARRGDAHESVVEWARGRRYFDLTPPKSTGRETFGVPFARDVYDRVRSISNATSDDVVATAVAIVASSIATQIERWLPPASEVLISGGGARNPALVDAIRAWMPGPAVRHFDEVFFDGDAKEAVAFAYMAWRTVHGLPSNVPAATGASGPRVLGNLIG